MSCLLKSNLFLWTHHDIMKFSDKNLQYIFWNKLCLIVTANIYLEAVIHYWGLHNLGMLKSSIINSDLTCLLFLYGNAYLV